VHNTMLQSYAISLALFHLQRHSDHHANPSRRYQSLRHFDDVPQLPSGYFGMFPLACVPPLWFRVMDARLMALPQVRGDLSRVTVDPRRRRQLEARYGRPAPLTSADSAGPSR
jgi:alkane 1-monooxygenase